MNLTLLVAKAHGGMGMLLLLLAIASFGMAVKAIISATDDRLNRVANKAALLETVIAGLVTITGLIAIITGPWPVSSGWIWAGLLIMVIYSILLKRLTKPARLATTEGAGAARWAGLQLIHIVLIIAVFALMRLKPF